MVVDNPPFSILQRIVNFYMARGIWFFLFAPALTLLRRRYDVCCIGMPDEGEDVAALNIQIDAALMARLRARAADEGISLTACVEGILRDSLN